MTPVRHIVDVLEKISGCDITDLDRPVSGPMKFCCDMTTMHRLIDWQPRYSVEAGVTDTYERMKAWSTR
jgi:nucleoside-diphosphate-sugar epimerase